MGEKISKFANFNYHLMRFLEDIEVYICIPINTKPDLFTDTYGHPETYCFWKFYMLSTKYKKSASPKLAVFEIIGFQI